MTHSALIVSLVLVFVLATGPLLHGFLTTFIICYYYTKGNRNAKETGREGGSFWVFMVYLQIEGHHRLNLKKS